MRTLWDHSQGPGLQNLEFMPKPNRAGATVSDLRCVELLNTIKDDGEFASRASGAVSSASAMPVFEFGRGAAEQYNSGISCWQDGSVDYFP